jgi:hypothetical protein
MCDQPPQRVQDRTCSLNTGIFAENVLRIAMTALSKKEIVAGLKKLGIHSDLEIDSFLKEYKEYCTDESNVHFQQAYRKNKLMYRSFPNRFNQACLSAVTFIGNVLSIPKVKVHNQSKR